ncbi:MAG: hypothetical protein WCV91_06570, partial [Candidatus Margulisiibacteriota bacterium]
MVNTIYRAKLLARTDREFASSPLIARRPYLSTAQKALLIKLGIDPNHHYLARNGKVNLHVHSAYSDGAHSIR